MTQVFMAFLLTSVIGSAAALLLMLLRGVTKNRFSASWHYYMWLGVLVVMMLPIKINLPKPEAIEDLLPSSQKDVVLQETEEEKETRKNNFIQEAVDKNEEIDKVLQDSALSENHAVNNEPVNKNLIEGNAVASFEKTALMFIESKLAVVAHIWVIGVILISLFKIINYAFFLHRVDKNSELISCTRVMAYTTRRVTVKESPVVSSPFVTGVIKPMLIFPKAEFSEDQIDSILNHEMTHLNRNDVLYKWFISLVKSIHWFNPVIYFISKQINLDCEISCDIEATKHLNEDGVKKYINTILMLLNNASLKAIPLTTQMTSSKKTLKIRFERLKNRKTINGWMCALSIALATVILGVTVTLSGILATKVQIEENTIETEVTEELIVDISRKPLFEKETVTYDEIIRRYREAISEEWGPATLESGDINEIVRYHFLSPPSFNIHQQDPLETIGYSLQDVNGDGIEELIIGQALANGIYEMYTMIDGSAKKILSAEFNDDWYIINDENGYIIAQEDMIGHNMVNAYYYTLEGGILYPVQAVMIYNAPDDVPWVMESSDEDIDFQKAQSIIEGYRARYVAPEYIPFASVTNEEIKAKFYEAYEFWNAWVYGQVYRAYDTNVDYANGLWRESITQESPIQTSTQLENEIRNHFTTELSETFLMQLSPEDKDGKLYVTCHDVGGSSIEFENIQIKKIDNRRYLMTFDRRTFYEAFEGNVKSFEVYCVLENGQWVFENVGEDAFFYSHYVESIYDGEKFAPYNDVLKKYYSALWLDWNYDRLEQEDLSILASSGAASVRVGYCFMDVNGDDQEELLIGKFDTDKDYWSKIIYDMYTVKDGKPYRLLKSTPRDYYLLFEEDGEYKIANEVYISNPCTCYSYYNIGTSELVLEKAVIANLEESEENPWFMAYDEDHDTSNDTPIDEATALSIVEGRWLKYIAPDFIPFEGL